MEDDAEIDGSRSYHRCNLTLFPSMCCVHICLLLLSRHVKMCGINNYHCFVLSWNTLRKCLKISGVWMWRFQLPNLCGTCPQERIPTRYVHQSIKIANWTAWLAANCPQHSLAADANSVYTNTESGIPVWKLPGYHVTLKFMKRESIEYWRFALRYLTLWNQLHETFCPKWN
jgi:hypothetical protein